MGGIPKKSRQMEKIHGGIHESDDSSTSTLRKIPQTSVIDFEISAWPREVNQLKWMAWISDAHVRRVKLHARL